MIISEESKDKGRRVREVLSKNSSSRSASNMAGFDLVPELEDYALGINFGEIWSREQLNIKTRCAVTIGMLTALGVEPQIKSYVEYSLNAGWTPEEVAEMFVQCISYLGLPRALNGLRCAGEVFAERRLTTNQEKG
jgi:4-carboxymuconolactone decarboxylase